MLGTMAGLWISLFLIVFGGIMIAGISLGSSLGSSQVEIKKNSILRFDLDGVILDREQPMSFMQLVRDEKRNAPTLDDMLSSLKVAAKDDRIDGLYLNCKGASMGSASRQELVEAINCFKASGKWVYAYADNYYAQGDYLLATTADYLVLNPIGAVDIHGVGGITPFFSGLLEKLGIKMQVLKVGTYKSAVEPYILKSMSEPARRQMQQYCDTIWNYVSHTIAANRMLSDSLVRALASQFISTRPAEFFKSENLVDTLLYARQSDNFLRELTDREADEELRMLTPSDYLSATDLMSGMAVPERHIAVLYALGEISDTGSEGIVGDKLTKEIIDLADDDDVAGLVMRVNSPGGSAFASEQIWESLEYFKSKGKPFYVSMGDVAASGGYYISCGADCIFADRTTITGSIGVFGLVPDLSGLVSGKLGVTFSTVATNPNMSVSIMEPMSTEASAAMQKNVEDIYDLFTGRVAAGRKMTVEKVKEIAEGRVWIGSDALGLGLVDNLGSLEDAVCAMASDLGLTAGDIREYPNREEKLWEKILRQSGGIEDLKADEWSFEAIREKLFLERILKSSPVMARMEDVIIK